jgi:hypothetical protein
MTQATIGSIIMTGVIIIPLSLFTIKLLIKGIKKEVKQ